MDDQDAEVQVWEGELLFTVCTLLLQMEIY